jgi:hypothetical protein
VAPLALDDGEPVGTGSVGRIYMYEASFERYWFGIEVLPDARRRGVGTALWAAVSDVARADGKTGLQTDVSEAQVDGVEFLEHRDFEVFERSKMVRLDLRGMEPPVVAAPRGIALTTLSARPDLETGLHAVAVEAYADIPSADEPLAAGSLVEFLARDVHREGIPAGPGDRRTSSPTGRRLGVAHVQPADDDA